MDVIVWIEGASINGLTPCGDPDNDYYPYEVHVAEKTTILDITVNPDLTDGDWESVDFNLEADGFEEDYGSDWMDVYEE